MSQSMESILDNVAKMAQKKKDTATLGKVISTWSEKKKEQYRTNRNIWESHRIMRWIISQHPHRHLKLVRRNSGIGTYVTKDPDVIRYRQEKELQNAKVMATFRLYYNALKGESVTQEEFNILYKLTEEWEAGLNGRTLEENVRAARITQAEKNRLVVELEGNPDVDISKVRALWKCAPPLGSSGRRAGATKGRVKVAVEGQEGVFIC